jgi:hypothetical protein
MLLNNRLKRWRIAHPFWSILLALALAGAVAVPVMAHFVYEKEWVAHHEGQCVEARSEISHGNDNGGYSQVRMWLRSTIPNPYGATCQSWWSNFKKAKLRIRLFYKPIGFGDWHVCTTAGPWIWDWGSGVTHNFDWRREKYWDRPCGTANYATSGGAWGWHDNDWRGGNVWSGSHRLP